MYIPGLVMQQLISLLDNVRGNNGTTLSYNIPHINVGMQSYFVSKDYYDYQWRTGNKGQVVKCLKNETVAGSCSSRGGAECDNLLDGTRYFEDVWCMEMEGFEHSNCEDKFGGYGTQLSCAAENKFVGAVCGSGENTDCNGHYHMISCCDGKFVSGPKQGKKLASAPGNCKWYYNFGGGNIFCPEEDTMVVGRCTSDQDNYCSNHEDSHGIHCCKVFSVDDDN